MDLTTTNTSSIPITKSWLLPVFFLLGIFAVGTFTIATHQGAGATPDSAAYVGAAASFMKGEGLRVPFGESISDPLVHFPPLYPLLLATSGFFGTNPLDGARWLNAILYVVNLSLVIMAVQRYARSPLWAAAAGGLLFVVSPGMLQLHVMVWSEALFIALCLSSLIFEARFFEEKRLWQLAAAAVLAGLASITRYAGLAVIGAGVLGLLFIHRASIEKRIAYSIAYVSTAIFPLVLWVLRNHYLTGSTVNRELLFHPIGVENAWQLFDTTARWMLLPASSWWVRYVSLFIFLLAVVVVAWAVRPVYFSSKDRQVGSALPSLLGVFVLVYAGFLILSISLIDANTPLDERILSPIYVCLLTLIVLVIDRLAIAQTRLAAFAAIALLCFSVASTWKTLSTARALYGTGIGITSVSVNDPFLIQAIHDLPNDQIIYANAPEVVYLQTGRSTLRLPKRVNLIASQGNDSYESEMQAVKENMLQNGGSLIYINWVQGKTIVQEDILREELPLRLLLRSELGSIYTISNNAQ